MIPIPFTGSITTIAISTDINNNLVANVTWTRSDLQVFTLPTMSISGDNYIGLSEIKQVVLNQLAVMNQVVTADLVGVTLSTIIAQVTQSQLPG